MGDFTEFSLPVRLFLRAYRWRRIDPLPWTPLTKPLAQARWALISSAGLTAPGQQPFDDSVPGGDVSFRQIPTDTVLADLQESHRSESFDHAGLRQDANLVFPLERARELVHRGGAGPLNHRHLSFMGSITAPGRLVKQTAPEAAGWLAEDAIDAALLVPV
jgi:D-proline reductase (dithiol) PrdB